MNELWDKNSNPEWSDRRDRYPLKESIEQSVSRKTGLYIWCCMAKCSINFSDLFAMRLRWIFSASSILYLLPSSYSIALKPSYATRIPFGCFEHSLFIDLLYIFCLCRWNVRKWDNNSTKMPAYRSIYRVGFF